MGTIKKVTVTKIDDMNQLPFHQGETVKFGIDGEWYEIDLNKRNAISFRNYLGRYVSAARSTRTTHTAAPRQRVAPSQAVKIRAWASSAGVWDKKAGRLPHHVIDKFFAENPEG